MNKKTVNHRSLSIIAGISYLIIFFSAVFANFFVIASIQNEPLVTLQENQLMVRLGIMAFLLTVVFDVVVAWALQKLYHDHVLSSLSTYFRLMHAAIMGVSVYAIVECLSLSSEVEIIKHIDTFNTIWLIGLFFFGFHLILLGQILKRPLLISIFLIIAGCMYIIDTGAHFLLSDYKKYSSIFILLVAIPSVIGEMALAIWLLAKKDLIK